MKRIWTALLCLLLLPACSLAFDLTPYELEPLGIYDFAHQVLPIARGEYIRIHSHSIPGDTILHTLDYYKNGQLHLQLLLPEYKYAGYSSFFLQDGSVGVMQLTDRIEGTQIWKKDYTLFTLSGGELINPRTFEGEPYMLKRFDGGYAGVRGDGDELSELLIYDEALSLRLRHPLPLNNTRIQAAFSAGEDVFVLILHQGMKPDVIAMRISADNTVAWTYTYAEEAYHYNDLHPDGQRGALMTGSLASDYKQYRVTHLNADGECDWNKTLSVKKAVIHPIQAVAQGDGTVTLYGSAVAKSRDLFTVFAMNMDAQGNVLSLDVRDYSAREDTSPEILFSSDGTPYVHSIVVDSRPAVLVPFDDLPKAQDPGITLK